MFPSYDIIEQSVWDLVKRAEKDAHMFPTISVGYAIAETLSFIGSLATEDVDNDQIMDLYVRLASLFVAGYLYGKGLLAQA